MTKKVPNIKHQAITDGNATEGAITDGDSSIGRMIRDNTSHLFASRILKSHTQTTEYARFFQRSEVAKQTKITTNKNRNTQAAYQPSLDYKISASGLKLFRRAPISLEAELERLMGRAHHADPNEPIFKQIMALLASPEGESLLDTYKSKNYEQRTVLEHAIHLNVSGALDGIIQKLLDRPALRNQLRPQYKAMLAKNLLALNFPHEQELGYKSSAPSFSGQG